MKIKQWIAVSILILSTACSNQVFTPSEGFVEYDQIKSISSQELLAFAILTEGTNKESGEKFIAHAATSDTNLEKDLEENPIEISIEELGETVRIITKASSGDSNYLLIKTESEKHLWIAY